MNNPPFPQACPELLTARAAAHEKVKTTSYTCAAATDDHFHTHRCWLVWVFLRLF